MKKIQILNRTVIAIIMGLILLLSRTEVVNAVYAENVDLGASSSFAVLASSELTNTGTTTISGTAGNNIGVYAGSAITGTASIVNTGGSMYSATSEAMNAQTALTEAIDNIQGRASTTIPRQLAGANLVAGVYSSTDGDFALGGTLTLNAEGDSNAVFIFKTASTLITASASNMVLLNGADACRIFWQVGSSATLGTGSTLYGHVLATTSITATTRAKVIGSLLASTGAVTLDSNTIVNNACGATTATLVVVKNVINDNNGISVAADFSINVTSNNVDVSGSPANGNAIGTTYTLAPGSYVITEPAHSGYDLSFTGDIESNGTVTLVAGETRTITLNNNDIPPVSADTPTPQPTTTPAPLPTTSSDQGMLILFGGLIAIVGALGWYVKRKV